MLELLVQAPMPLGSSWTCSEFRRYLRSLGHRPVPTVGEIAATLDAPGMHRYGVNRGYNATGGVVYGTNPPIARRELRAHAEPSPASAFGASPPRPTRVSSVRRTAGRGRDGAPRKTTTQVKV